MKRHLILLLATMLSAYVFSQESKFAIGIEAAPTLTWLSGNSLLSNDEARISFAGGLNLKYDVNSRFAVKSGFGFERKGNKTELIFTDEFGQAQGELTIESNFNYMILPVLGSFTTNGNVKFFFDFGIYTGFLISQNNVREAFLENPKDSDDNTSSYKRFDFGIMTGPGISFPLAEKLTIDMSLNASFGLVNISQRDVINNDSLKPNSLKFVLGLRYSI